MFNTGETSQRSLDDKNFKRHLSSFGRFKLECHQYRSKGNVMFSQACVILFTIGLTATRSLLILVTTQLANILLECFLVFSIFKVQNVRINKQFQQQNVTSSED